MTNEERDLIAKFIARIGGTQQAGGGFAPGSVPQTRAPLPPIDREADAFIAQQFDAHPEAKYRMTQTALVQEAALVDAQNRLQQMQWELDQARASMQQGQQGGQQRGFLGGLFGGGQPQARPQGPQQQGLWGGQPQGYPGQQPQPQPQMAPTAQPGMFQRGGSGFLGSALTTAAGVAGGMVAGNMLMNAFGGGHHGAGASPWGQSADAGGGAFDGGGVAPVMDQGGGFADQGSDPFSQAGYDPNQGGGWDQADAGGFDGGGFDGGGFDDTV